jgi:hypothetical protein
MRRAYACAVSQGAPARHGTVRAKPQPTLHAVCRPPYTSSPADVLDILQPGNQMIVALDQLLEDTEEELAQHQHTLTPQRPDRNPPPAAAAAPSGLLSSRRRASSVNQAGPSKADTSGSGPQTPGWGATPGPSAGAGAGSSPQSAPTPGKQVVQDLKRRLEPRLARLHSIISSLDVSETYCALNCAAQLACQASHLP